MRLLIIDNFYPAFLGAQYGRRPELRHASYDEQRRALMETFFGTADSYSHALTGLGHDAHEVVSNCRPLQEAWAREHGVPLHTRFGRRLRKDWESAVVLAQAEHFRANAILVQLHTPLPIETLVRLRDHAPVVVAQIASEEPSEDVLRAFDLVLTSFPHYVERLRERGIGSAYLPLGFDPRVTDRLGAVERTAPAVFVGNVGLSQHGRGSRVLEQAAREAPIEFWGYGAGDWPEDSPLRQRFHGEAWGIDMYRVLASARIVVNRHIDVAEGHANNMRLFEATGTGGLLLTDQASNLSELFEVGREVVTYADAADLSGKIAHYLEHEEERARIATAGRDRTLRDHTWAVRMRELDTILAPLLEGAPKAAACE
jgi:spore maturation protein CgeB